MNQICWFFKSVVSLSPDFREAPRDASRGTSPTGGCGWFKVSMWDEDVNVSSLVVQGMRKSDVRFSNSTFLFFDVLHSRFDTKKTGGCLNVRWWRCHADAWPPSSRSRHQQNGAKHCKILCPGQNATKQLCFWKINWINCFLYFFGDVKPM